MQVIIIEDEPRGRETLKNLLTEYCDNIEIAGMAGSVKEGIHVIRNARPDLVFLDIELHSGTGFEILESVDRFDFEVVFTTAFENYAIRAIKFSAIDYLLKPIDISELRDAVEKVRQRREVSSRNNKLWNLVQNFHRQADEQKIITLSTLDGFEFIEVSNILKLEASGAYTMFFIKPDRKLLVSKNLKEYEMLLSQNNFYRVHHSCLINLNEVEKYVKSDGGYIVLKGGSTASISQRRKERFIKLMNLMNVG
jgi:two-component system LytT family response regulator